MKEKILIIEDEEDLVKGLKLNLAGEGYELTWAYDGQEGLRKALEEKPDLIILDIMLPKLYKKVRVESLAVFGWKMIAFAIYE